MLCKVKIKCNIDCDTIQKLSDKHHLSGMLNKIRVDKTVGSQVKSGYLIKQDQTKSRKLEILSLLLALNMRFTLP